MTGRVEKYNAILGVVFALAGFIIWHNTKVPLSVIAGSLLAGINFLALAWIIKKITEPDTNKFLPGAMALVKLVLLIFILWAIIKWLPINIVAFLVGLSTIVVAIILSLLTNKNERI